MLVLPIDDVDIYKKRDRLIVKVRIFSTDYQSTVSFSVLKHYNDFLQKEAKDVSNMEFVLHHWRPIRIYTNKHDQKLVVIGYFDRKTDNSVGLNILHRLL